MRSLSYALAGVVGVAFASSNQSLPTVDLGYSIHRATLNASATPYYNFSNIRYAEPPVGALRFAPPIPPRGRNTTINDGQVSVIPTQAGPDWDVIAAGFIDAYLTEGNISIYENETTANALLTNSTAAAPDPGQSEDCLFLDVIVPEKIFSAGPSNRTSKGAPVLVWIYGGGYTEGSKVSSGSPATLIAKSQIEETDEGVVYVAMNYRLGLFGWLAGNEDVTSNVGLLDQRLALDWVQKYIHLFGGDPSRVTVMGESAGGGSIMHHITSYGGKGTVPFQQAIPQSPAFQIMVPEQYTKLFSYVLGNASLMSNQSITTAEQLRALPYSVLNAVNTAIISASDYGSFTFGPVVDGTPNSYVPDLPLRLVAEGKFHNVSIMVGHNGDEGLLFTTPFVTTELEEVAQLGFIFPTANMSTIDYLADVLYPAVYNGTYGYTNAIGRTAQIISDFLVGCNAHYLDMMLSPSYGYYFDVPPALHGEDVDYTFFNGDTVTSDDGLGVNQDIAYEFQRYLVTFAMNGVPTSLGSYEGVPTGKALQTFSMYGSNDTVSVIDFNVVGEKIRDPAARSQCTFWAEAPYFVLGSQ